MASAATISHSVPGRLRVRVQATSVGERDEVLDAVASLGRTPGVRQVRTDHRTGSALVTYDPDELELDALVGLLRGAHAALRALAPPSVVSSLDAGISETASVIRSGVRVADGSVMRATRGVVDLRVLVPIGLAGLSASQLVRNGIGLKTIPWYVLAYYAFDSFVKLHDGAEAASTLALQQATVDGPAP